MWGTAPSSRPGDGVGWFCESLGVTALTGRNPHSSACPPRCSLLPSAVGIADEGGYWDIVGVSPWPGSFSTCAGLCEGERFFNFQRVRRYEPRRPMSVPMKTAPIAIPASRPAEIPPEEVQPWELPPDPGGLPPGPIHSVVLLPGEMPGACELW